MASWKITCSDVVEGMRKLDQSGQPIPEFRCDVKSVGVMLTFSPEDYNVVTLNDQCRQLVRQMNSLSDEWSLRTHVWFKLDDEVDNMELAMSQHATSIRS